VKPQVQTPVPSKRKRKRKTIDAAGEAKLCFCPASVLLWGSLTKR
jgi:hypothetical protein